MVPDSELTATDDQGENVVVSRRLIKRSCHSKVNSVV